MDFYVAIAQRLSANPGPEGPGFAEEQQFLKKQLVKLPACQLIIFNDTRRFCARPSAVPLLEIAWSLP